jgi:peptidoglycan/LPS O-acetylase OafA/YrhL
MTAYRRDIDGLRAVSIIVVLMFHAGFGDWAGGFIGVDVFFVISGYLITSLIASQLQTGTFSLATFYERRIRRLLAATIPVVLFTTLFAWAFFTTEHFSAYAQSVIAFATYTSNWFFYSQGGYFAAGSETAPLLHTWSLAVEEQFYLVFPVVMIALFRRPALVRPVLAAVALASLGYSQWLLTTGQLDLAFYSTLSRIWELMLGALLALSPGLMVRGRIAATAMRVAGLGLILVPVFTYSAQTAFPGFAALPPVLGALLLLAADPQRTDPVLRLLESAPATWIGRISYSLYLWHWPVIGAMETVVFDHNDLHKVLALLLSFALAALSYRYIEQPIRTRERLPKGRDMAGLLAATTAASVAFGSYGWLSGGWPGRMPPEVERVAAAGSVRASYADSCQNVSDKPPTFCKVGGKSGAADLVLWGDSHAASLESALRKYAEERGLTLGLAVRLDCPPLAGIWRSKDPTKLCRTFNDAAVDFIAREKPRLVVVVGRWSVYTNGPQLLRDDERTAGNRAESQAVFAAAVERTLQAIKGPTTVFVEQVPENFGDIPSAYLVLSRLGLPIDTVASPVDKHRKRMQAMDATLDQAASRNAFVRFDPADAFCSRGPRCVAEADGRLLYSDDDHLNLDGSLFLYPALAAALDAALAKSSAP